ncbi:MAG TPA: DUF2304 domain-containing protein [Rubneribacter badeniensis]|uniref:DUF2304 domain-containing protein n=1 Tax=Rubneribacter badeniensis TaxID=2070688 RepID=A0A9D3ADS7_9ACTN|nr:DUF2304 domain-containing protein [Rubneribacter badeniensis]
MTVLFKIALLAGAVCVLAFILRKIRRAEMKISDSVFWFLFAASLVLLALLPPIAFFFSDVLGIESPANFVFLYVIAVLLVREFISTVEISKLRSRLTTLAQNEALRNGALPKAEETADDARGDNSR